MSSRISAGSKGERSPAAAKISSTLLVPPIRHRSNQYREDEIRAIVNECAERRTYDGRHLRVIVRAGEVVKNELG